jgi:hypothetical protein
MDIYEFRTYVGQRGTDRRFGVRPGAKVLSEANGLLNNLDYLEDWREEVTFVYAGGQGIEEERTVVTVSDSVRLAASPFNRREGWFDGRIYGDSALSNAAQKRLYDGRPVRRFTAEINDQPGFVYGKDWDFGDKLTAVLDDGQQIDIEVNVVSGRLDENGKETIRARLEYVN